ncbi:hypothetical protein RIF29_39396 [Crotalaria pallida]|uniref:DUF4283 domain-containing protein n=1 Tax=Crotalaria pallida TaxID=3830 RepID=A0AAN9E3K3_CROPI
MLLLAMEAMKMMMNGTKFGQEVLECGWLGDLLCLDNIWFGNKKLWANISKYEKNSTLHHKSVEARKEHGHVTIPKPKFFEREKSKNGAVADLVFNVKLEFLSPLDKCMVGKVKRDIDLSSIPSMVRNEGIISLEVKPLCGDMVMMSVMDGEDWNDLWHDDYQDWWMLTGGSFVSMYPSTKLMARIAWVTCYGIPAHAWTEEFFRSLIEKTSGSFVSFHPSTKLIARLDVALVQIRYNFPELINKFVVFNIFIVKQLVGLGFCCNSEYGEGGQWRRNMMNWVSKSHLETETTNESFVEETMMDGEGRFLENHINDLGERKTGGSYVSLHPSTKLMARLDVALVQIRYNFPELINKCVRSIVNSVVFNIFIVEQPVGLSFCCNGEYGEDDSDTHNPLRIAWVTCYGIPAHAWTEELFSSLIEKTGGSFVSLHPSTKLMARLDVALVHIRYNFPELINKCVKSMVNNVVSNIFIVEQPVGLGFCYNGEYGEGGQWRRNLINLLEENMKMFLSNKVVNSKTLNDGVNNGHGFDLNITAYVSCLNGSDSNSVHNNWHGFLPSVSAAPSLSLGQEVVLGSQELTGHEGEPNGMLGHEFKGANNCLVSKRRTPEEIMCEALNVDLLDQGPNSTLPVTSQARRISELKKGKRLSQKK